MLAFSGSGEVAELFLRIALSDLHRDGRESHLRTFILKTYEYVHPFVGNTAHLTKFTRDIAHIRRGTREDRAGRTWMN